MKAEDTVIPVEPHSQRVWCHHCGEEFGIESKIEYERTVQAEISFKAGYKQGAEDNYKAGQDDYKAGIKEVVEFVESTGEMHHTSKIAKEWQAQLKEWGIDEDGV